MGLVLRHHLGTLTRGLPSRSFLDFLLGFEDGPFHGCLRHLVTVEDRDDVDVEVAESHQDVVEHRRELGALGGELHRCLLLEELEAPAQHAVHHGTPDELLDICENLPFERDARAVDALAGAFGRHRAQLRVGVDDARDVGHDALTAHHETAVHLELRRDATGQRADAASVAEGVRHLDDAFERRRKAVLLRRGHLEPPPFSGRNVEIV